MKKANVVFGIMIVLVAMLIVLGINASNQPEDLVIKGKGIDGQGNVWLIVSNCDTCDATPVPVSKYEWDTYVVGEKYP